MTSRSASRDRPTPADVRDAHATTSAGRPQELGLPLRARARPLVVSGRSRTARSRASTSTAARHGRHLGRAAAMPGVRRQVRGDGTQHGARRRRRGVLNAELMQAARHALRSDAMVVMKFGGTSVEDQAASRRSRRLAPIVCARRRAAIAACPSSWSRRCRASTDRLLERGGRRSGAMPSGVAEAHAVLARLVTRHVTVPTAAHQADDARRRASSSRREFDELERIAARDGAFCARCRRARATPSPPSASSRAPARGGRAHAARAAGALCRRPRRYSSRMPSTARRAADPDGDHRSSTARARRSAARGRPDAGPGRLRRRHARRRHDDAGTRWLRLLRVARSAPACGAAEIQIWTDVDGMLTADPRVVRARARAAAVVRRGLRAGVFRRQGAAPEHHPAGGRRRNIPVRILNSHRPEARGTTDHRRTPPTPERR